MIILVGGLVVVGLVGLVWWIAVQNRRSYECTSCGSTITVEYLEAHNCNICGAPLRQTDGKPPSGRFDGP